MAGQTTRTLRPEDELAHYRIVGPLGAGGMGEVYLAVDQSLGRNVALKVLPPSLVRSEERVRRFVLEAKSASSLNHPNIVTIHEIGQDAVRSQDVTDSSSVHYIAMELVSGKTLSTLIHEERTELRTLIGYLAQAADGLAKAHAAGIVHRDLKPGNIMVSADGFAKVLDFGLAKLTESRGDDGGGDKTLNLDETGEGVVIGTAGYMSPEQVQGKVVDHRSDIFAFGCILYEAATRQRAFAAESSIDTMHKIVHDKPAPIEDLNARVPAELRRLIRRCLQKNPDQRLQSIKDLALELRDIEAEFDALSASATSGTMTSGVAPLAPTRRSSGGIWAGAIAIALLGVALTVWVLRRGQESTPSLADVRISAQTSSGDVVSADLSPDGRLLAYLTQRAGLTSLHVRQIATGSDVEIIAPTQTRIQNPSFSSDGNYLFYGAPRPDKLNYFALYQVPSLGGTPREIAFDVDSKVSCAPDGKQFVFLRHTPDPPADLVVVFDLTSRQERVLVKIDDPAAVGAGPVWSPDGKRIAIAVIEADADLVGTIVMLDARSGERSDFKQLRRHVLNSLAWVRDGDALLLTGVDVSNTIFEQTQLLSYPEGVLTRITNDFNNYDTVSAARSENQACAVRRTRVANAYLAGAGPMRRITTVANPENSLGDLAGADSNAVVFSAPRDGVLRIIMSSTDGSDVRSLSEGKSHAFGVMAAAGTIAFNWVDETGIHVWCSKIDGTGLRQLGSGLGQQIRGLSPDGKLGLIETTGESTRKFSVLSTEDGQLHTQLEGIVTSEPFSPDSQHVLVALQKPDARGLMSNQWRLLSLAGGEAKAEFQLPEGALSLRWLPDGTGVSYGERSDPHWNIHALPFGGDAAPVTRVASGRILQHRWALDSGRLALLIRDGDSSNLWVGGNGSDPVQVTQFTIETIFDFDWMPGGNQLWILAGTTAADAVLVRNLP